MKTGDTVRDAQGRTFQVGQLLGRGLWGRSYAARDDASGNNWVIKVPHRAADLPPEAAGLADACAEIALEQARLMESGACPVVPRLECRLALPDGAIALVMPKASATLESRLAGGAPLDEVLGLLGKATQQLIGFAGVQPFHGNLKPTNVLIGERGNVLLSDPVTPAVRRVFLDLVRITRGAHQWSAPEVRDATTTVPFGPQSDSFSLAMVLFRAAMAGPGHERAAELPLDGLTKARLVSLKDRVLNRLKLEHSNPRFHSRVSDRLAALLNRALSRQTSPSPPYRFRRLDELAQRLGEIQAMVHPTVTGVGRLILDQRGASGSFLTDGPVGFSCTVACSEGVEHHEEVACGLALFDLDRDERVRVEECAYTVDRHPSGRFRFGFKISQLPPGGFRVRVAFAIRESGDEPLTAQGEFRVRPAPGYVPPRQEPVATPIPMEHTRDPVSASEARATEPGVRAAPSPAVLPPRSAAAVVASPAAPGPLVAPREVHRDPISAPSAPPMALRAVCAAEEVADDASSSFPAPTPIRPAAPVEPSRSVVPRRAAAPVVALVTPEPTRDPASVSATGRPGERVAAPQRATPAARRADHVRSRPSPRPEGPLPGHRPTAPSPHIHAAPQAPAQPQALSRPTAHGASAAAQLGPQPAPRVDAVASSAPLMDFAKDARTIPGARVASIAAAQPEPAFRSLGRWSELPLPVQDDDFGLGLGGAPLGPQPDLPEVLLEPETDDGAGFQGPVGALIARLVETVRGDAYVMFIGAAAVVILLLTVLLVILKG